MTYLAVGDLSQLSLKERMRRLVAAEGEKPMERAEEILREAVSPDIVEMVGAIEDPVQRQANALRNKLGTMDPASAESAQLRQQLVNVLAGVAPPLRNMLSWVEKKEDRAYINEIIKGYEMQAAAVLPGEPSKKKTIKRVAIAAAVAAGLGAVWLLVSSLRGK